MEIGKKSLCFISGFPDLRLSLVLIYEVSNFLFYFLVYLVKGFLMSAFPFFREKIVNFSNVTIF